MTKFVIFTITCVLSYFRAVRRVYGRTWRFWLLLNKRLVWLPPLYPAALAWPDFTGYYEEL